MTQNQIFSESEGDAWYARNRASLQAVADLRFRTDVETVCGELRPLRDQIETMLEIGASNGLKLEQICRELSCRGHGIDPSELAVAEGNARLAGTDVTLSVGRSESLAFEDRQFDLVYFGFSLYLCDRDKILQSLGEADRVLRPGGFLAITDFDPEAPKANPYAHLPGLLAFKQDYAAILTATSLFHLIAKRSYSHRQAYFDPDPDERVATWILYKKPALRAG